MFCIWDPDCGFNQITATSQAAHRAAFEYLEELWMSSRMSFGTTNAPAIFACNMAPTIKDIKVELKEKVLNHDVDNYYDDCIQSGLVEDWLGCLKATDIFFSKAMQHGWKFKASKMHIAYPEVKILGVIISAKGKHVNPSKVDTLLAMHIPHNASEVRSFVRLICWFQEHIKGLA